MTRSALGQANLISVVLLVGVSLVVGVSIVALFSSQAAVISSREDISDVVNNAAASEFVTLVYHSCINSSAGYNCTFLFKVVLLSYGVRNYSLIVPLITSGSISNIYIERDLTIQLWSEANVSYLKVPPNSVDYVPVAVAPRNVLGDDVFLTVNGLSFKSLGIDIVPIYKIPVFNTSPYPSVYVVINFVTTSGGNYDLTLYTFVQVGSKFYGVERISFPLGGGA